MTIICEGDDDACRDLNVDCNADHCILECNDNACKGSFNVVLGRATQSYKCTGNNCPALPKSFTPSPTTNPSQVPTKYPSFSPTRVPTLIPTYSPTKLPSLQPTKDPSQRPTNSPILEGEVNDESDGDDEEIDENTGLISTDPQNWTVGNYLLISVIVLVLIIIVIVGCCVCYKRNIHKKQLKTSDMLEKDKDALAHIVSVSKNDNVETKSGTIAKKTNDESSDSEILYDAKSKQTPKAIELHKSDAKLVQTKGQQMEESINDNEDHVFINTADEGNNTISTGIDDNVTVDENDKLYTKPVNKTTTNKGSDSDDNDNDEMYTKSAKKTTKYL